MLSLQWDIFNIPGIILFFLDWSLIAELEAIRDLWRVEIGGLILQCVM